MLFADEDGVAEWLGRLLAIGEELGRARTLKAILHAEEFDQRAQVSLDSQLDGDPLQAFDTWRSKWCSRAVVAQECIWHYQESKCTQCGRNAFKQHWGEQAHRDALARFSIGQTFLFTINRIAAASSR